MSTALYCFSLRPHLCQWGGKHFLSHRRNSDRVMYNYGVPHSLSIIHPSLGPSLLSLPSPSPCPARWFAFVCICLYRLLSFLHFPELFTALHRLKNLSVLLSSLHFYVPYEIPSHKPKKSHFLLYPCYSSSFLTQSIHFFTLSSKSLYTAAAN